MIGKKLCLDICKHYSIYLPLVAKDCITVYGTISWKGVFEAIVDYLKHCKIYSSCGPLNKELIANKFKFRQIKDIFGNEVHISSVQ